MSRSPCAGSPEIAGFWSELVDFLSTPAAYGEADDRVKCLQTHISWVFLTSAHAYKLKKPVAFGFVDFSTMERRLEACRAEVRLNRRLAPDVYLGLTPITRDRQNRLRLGGTGPPLEWLVRMRRLPEDRCLRTMLANGTLLAREVDLLAERLLEFYRGLPPLPFRAEDYRALLERHVADNHRALVEFDFLPLGAVHRAHAAQRRLLTLHPGVFDARVCDGRIVEGHGDLRAEHVYFAPKPLVIDALEFSLELRSVDVVDELSFLAMECACSADSDVGYQILRRYCDGLRDNPPAVLLAFYEAYRASVRAKVAALRASQLNRMDPEQATARRSAEKFARWAEQRMSSFLRPLLLVITGGSGTGKTTLAQQLAESLGAAHLNTDSLRREDQGTAAPSEAFSQGRYSLEQRQRIYHLLLEKTLAALRRQPTVVIDGTFGSAAQRSDFARSVESLGGETLFLDCHCPLETARARVQTRRGQPNNVSEVSADHLEAQASQREPWSTGLRMAVVDTSGSPHQSYAEALEQLRGLCERP